METHLRFEEKKLVAVLDDADRPGADKQELLGPQACRRVLLKWTFRRSFSRARSSRTRPRCAK
jgi:hypothetical protein